jgi:hypothetical protein
LQQSRGTRREVVRRVQRQCYSAHLQTLSTASPTEAAVVQALGAAVGGRSLRP